MVIHVVWTSSTWQTHAFLLANLVKVPVTNVVVHLTLYQWEVDVNERVSVQVKQSMGALHKMKYIHKDTLI